MFGLGVNRLGATNQKPFSPASLFNNGEAGVWYDPSAASGSLDWRKNLLEYTESFDNSYWNRATSDSTAVPVVTANQAIAPDGTQTADLINLTAPADNQWALVRKTSLVTVNRAPEIQQSVWLKAYDSAQVGKKLNAYIYDQTNGGYKTVGVITLTSEWQRFIVSHVFPSGAQTIEVAFGKARNTAGGITQAETATQFYMWGAQLEEASTASSYQPILSAFKSAFKAAFPSHTLYQDYQGVTPVTAVGEPVGLMLDKSKGLKRGPELVTNGDFSNGTTGWTAQSGWAVANGVATCSSGSTYLYQVTGIPANTWVTATVEITDYTSGTLRLGSTGFAPTQFFSGLGKHSITFKTWASVGGVELRSNSFVGSIDNVSVTEIQGSHATQPTSTKRPIYARHPEGGIRNLLNYTEQFDNGYWSKGSNSTLTPNAIVAPDGTQTADALTNIGSSGSSFIGVQTIGTSGKGYTVSVYAKAGTNNTIRIGNVSSTVSACWFNLTDGTIGTDNGAGNTSSIQDVGNGWYRCTRYFASWAVGGTELFVGNSLVDGSFQPPSTPKNVYLWGAQLEEATEASNYQKVVTDIDVTESGVGEVYYLKFDGTDDGMSINNLTSGNTPLTALFGYSAEDCTAIDYLFDTISGRTIFGIEVGKIRYYDGGWLDFNADGKAIKVLTYDLVEDSAKIRIDGTQEYSDTTYDQRGINGETALFSGYDVNDAFVKGNMYQTILRAAESTDEEIAKAETFVANKTGLKAQVDGIATLDLNFGANTYTAKNSNGGVI